MARLREAFAAAPAANRYLIHTVFPPPLPGGIDKIPPPLAREGQGGGGVGVVAVPISDTVKEVVDGLVQKTVPRETLVDTRGPWLLTREALGDALARSVPRESEITDLVGLCERAKLRVRVFLDQ